MKFAKEDARYLSERKVLSDKFGSSELWDTIDHWPLFCGIGNLSRYLAISDLLRSTLTVPGHVAEFGSWRGANLLLLTKLLKIFDPLGSKVVHYESVAVREFLSAHGNAYRMEQVSHARQPTLVLRRESQS